MAVADQTLLDLVDAELAARLGAGAHVDYTTPDGARVRKSSLGELYDLKAKLERRIGASTGYLRTKASTRHAR